MNNVFRIVVFNLALSLLPALASAGEYELTYGKQFDLCHAYAKNLDTFTAMDHPMICEQPINPELKDFKTPEWVELDIKKNIHIVEQIVEKMIVSKSTPEETRTRLLQTYRSFALEGHILFYTTHIDINNDGKKDYVLRWKQLPAAKGCDHTDRFSFRDAGGQNLFILDASMNVKEGASKSFNYYNFHVFFYQGRTFLSAWSGGPNRPWPRYKPGKGGGRVRVYEPKPSGRKDGYFPVIRVCTFEYTEAKAGETP